MQLKIFEKDLGRFYKELMMIVFSESLDVDAVRGLERRVNELIMTVSDSVHEVEL